eukprot:gnl/TRDRNA2_/TRDRNA2_65225_c0_seq1.p1 gnl/TRDRNA2_/TRDRNA2_65225_c0~~gnl/TRDRNA2_/TRDRNA2_65225_c0_seq1.p1  ORF type:complete len:364 (+),score=47.22 gnl/TRDRNA2_/TRDRNA2_65225_c0_seq1:79-1092(+)
MADARRALVQATAGAAGGVLASFALMPLEVVKTRIQISQSGDVSNWQTIRSITATDGIPGLFCGVSAKCAETGSKNFVYFYLYDGLITAAKARTEISMAVNLILGYIAGVGTTSISMPLEVVSTRMQTDAHKGMGLVAVTKAILEKEGISGLFVGFWFNILLCINPAIQNVGFDNLKAYVLRRKAGGNSSKRVSLSASEAFVLGAVSKAIATVATFPLVRVKSMLQAGQKPAAPRELGDQHARRLSRSSSGPVLLNAISFREDKVESQHGPLERLCQLYRGLSSALLKGVLQAGLLYLTKDQVARFVVIVFKLSAKAMRGKDGRLKLGATSGRPLAS